MQLNYHIKKIITVLVLLVGIKSFSQTNKDHYIGVNLLQLPNSTVNLNYSIDCKPFITPFIEVGYTFGYDKKYDLSGQLFTSNNNYDDGYNLDKQLGGYLKVGAFFNLRKKFEKQNFLHLGLFFTNSIVHEEGKFLPPYSSMPYSYAKNVSHNVYLAGLSTSIGYEFCITKRLKTSFDLQLSLTNDNYSDLYSYRNFIPGMGYLDSKSKVYPMLALSLKYRL